MRPALRVTAKKIFPIWRKKSKCGLKGNYKGFKNKKSRAIHVIDIKKRKEGLVVSSCCFIVVYVIVLLYILIEIINDI